ncbi:MAG TPA: ferredoxin [Labilithrix sp.]|nr:ferredoxin [Labilithrix sp.]
MNETSLPTYSVVPDGCLRCGACSTLAPGIIAMGEKAAVIVRQPATPEEVKAADAALFNCVVLAIRKKSPSL